MMQVRSRRRDVGPGRPPRAADHDVGMERGRRGEDADADADGGRDSRRAGAAERVRELHADLGAPQKVLIDLGCSSHNAMWEKNHMLLFRASLEWLDKGTVNGAKEGVVKMGY